MTDEELAAIRERVEQATPGPWNVFKGVIWGRAGSSGPYQLSIAKNANISTVVEDTDSADWRDSRIGADLGFIAHARQDIPALLAEIAALREIVESVVAQEARPFSKLMWDVVVVYNDNGERECVFCNGEEIRQGGLIAGFNHEAGCPVTKARALLAQESQRIET
jgi:hypothetical protein